MTIVSNSQSTQEKFILSEMNGLQWQMCLNTPVHGPSHSIWWCRTLMLFIIDSISLYADDRYGCFCPLIYLQCVPVSKMGFVVADLVTICSDYKVGVSRSQTWRQCVPMTKMEVFGPCVTMTKMGVWGHWPDHNVFRQQRWEFLVHGWLQSSAKSPDQRVQIPDVWTTATDTQLSWTGKTGKRKSSLLYTDTDTDTQTHTHTPTDTQTHTHTHTQTHRHTHCSNQCWAVSKILHMYVTAAQSDLWYQSAVHTVIVQSKGQRYSRSSICVIVSFFTCNWLGSKHQLTN